MTILMFNKDPDNVVIMMDTLATTMDGQPHLFMTKTHLYPHLEMAMATTGLAQLSNRWAIMLQEGVIARDIEMLNLHAPDVLRRLWSNLHQEEDLGDQTATVYHFGLSETAGKYVGDPVGFWFVSRTR